MGDEMSDVGNVLFGLIIALILQIANRPESLLLWLAPGICALILALSLPKTKIGRLISVLIVFGLFCMNINLVPFLSKSCFMLKWPSCSNYVHKNWSLLYLFQFYLLRYLLCIATVVVMYRKYKKGEAPPGPSRFAVVLLIAFMAGHVISSSRIARIEMRQAQERRAHDEFVAKANAARKQRVQEAMLESCKKSGEIIHRKAENVYGILLLGKDSLFPNEDRDFIGPWEDNGLHRSGTPVGVSTKSGKTVFRYYSYYDTIKNDGWKHHSFSRLMATVETVVAMPPSVYDANNAVWGQDSNYEQYIVDLISKTKITYVNMGIKMGGLRYAVARYDVSTSEEKKNWIRGRVLKVIDLDTKEVMAERVSYLAGEKSYFDVTLACPPFSVNTDGRWQDKVRYDELEFVAKVLKPAPILARWE
jgi:hypothetical protein